MRLKSAIWVSAYLRRCAAEGVFGVVARRGEESAGAIFIKLVMSGSEVRLFTPAPQGLLDDAYGERKFVAARDGTQMPEDEADRLIAKEISFDPDLWVVAIEDRHGRHFLGDKLVTA